MSELKKQPTDNDHPWKLIFTHFFEEGILFVSPKLYDLIDWTREFVFLEQELPEAIKTKFHGSKICDKLAKVRLKDGKLAYLLVHIEIEANPRANFGKRFFWYRVLIFDKHKTEQIYSLAVYTGPPSKNQVSKYEFSFLDNKISFEFPILKVWEIDKDLLKNSDNLFALFLLAQQYANETKKDMDGRLEFRKHLFQLAIHKKIPKLKIIQCLIFVKYLTTMPTDMEIKYQTYENEVLNQNSLDMWITLDDVKHYDSILENRDGNSLQKMLREAEAKAEKAEAAAKSCAKAAAKEAAKEAKTKVVLKIYFELNIDLSSISKIVDMPLKEIKGIIAKEEEKRKRGKS